MPKARSINTLRLPDKDAKPTITASIPGGLQPRRMNAGLFLPRPAAIGSKKTISIEGVQCGTKLSNNCLLLMFILIVEDDFLISEYLRAILEVGGHRVIATFEADEAIEVLERVRDIQLVITDISMPGSMDGLRLAAAIRDRWPPIHLIVVTGLARPNRSELPRDSLFVPKPYGATEILSAVRYFQ